MYILRCLRQKYLFLTEVIQSETLFQMSMSVQLHFVKMAAHVLIFLEVIAVIANQDILETAVKKVKVHFVHYSFLEI